MFLINLIPLHVLVLMITGRFSHRIYVAYCTVYCLGTILSMQISFVGFQVSEDEALHSMPKLEKYHITPCLKSGTIPYIIMTAA